jgi:electron transfer flavoprotein beta subunit
MAAKKLLPVDLIIAGRQAIDGDTAQVGPQVAQKLGFPQVTYAEEILEVTEKEITIKRRLERGFEIVKVTRPVMITVHSSAPECRTRNSKRVMKFKKAQTPSEYQNADRDYEEFAKQCPCLQIFEWTVNDIDVEAEKLGLSGSPTKVKKIENVVFTAKETVTLSEGDDDINKMMKELIANHTIG